MAQQTAVEWFFETLLKSEPHILEWQKIFEQAKAMEKEQRIADYNVGYQDAQCNHINDAENYANERKYINDKSI
jgi:hypothetical protein